MEEMLRHLTRATQKQSTYNYLAERFGADTVDSAYSMGYVLRTPGPRAIYGITLRGRRELEAEE